MKPHGFLFLVYVDTKNSTAKLCEGGVYHMDAAALADAEAPYYRGEYAGNTPRKGLRHVAKYRRDAARYGWKGGRYELRCSLAGTQPPCIDVRASLVPWQLAAVHLYHSPDAIGPREW